MIALTGRLRAPERDTVPADHRYRSDGEAVDFFADAEGQEGVEVGGVFGCTLPLHHQHYGGPQEHKLPTLLGKATIAYE